MLGGMCWPSFPLNWPGPFGWWGRREHAIFRLQARDLPRQVARLVGAPAVHASHVGPVESQTPLMPGVPWRTEMIGETQICAADGTILARLTLEDGEGHISADVVPVATEPADPIEERFWIPVMTASLEAAWYGMNAQGRLVYRLRRLRGRHRWQEWPGGAPSRRAGPDRERRSPPLRDDGLSRAATRAMT